MRSLLTEAEFATSADRQPNAAVYRLVADNVDLTSADERIVRYVFSTGAVARDNHTVNQNGWDFSGFDRNPVFLFAHDMEQPPIGKVVEHTTRNGILVGSVHYIERDIYPFADTIFQMVKNRYLNAVSTSWLPIEWKWSQDRPGGIDYIKQDMLEISQAVVPAQISAIATARAAGIDTGPVVQWAERLLDAGGMAVLPRSELEQIRREAKMPVTRKAKAKPDEKTQAREIVDGIENNMGDEKKNQSVDGARKRGLYEVSELAWLLLQLGWIESSAEFEAEIEGDNSDIPARLTKLLNDAGMILVDMTKEEVAELLAVEKTTDAADVVEVLEQAVKTPGQRALMGLRAAAKSRHSVSVKLDTSGLSAEIERVGGLLRAGKVLSKSNVDSLARAMECHQEMGQCIQSVIDSATPADDGGEKQDASDLRLRKAKARQLKLKHAA